MISYLVYDYTKLDIGPETEAILDQLKGRESQVRIILNKADEITSSELLKIQNNLVWNLSPNLASLEPPRYVKIFVTYWKELCLNPISFFLGYMQDLSGVILTKLKLQKNCCKTKKLLCSEISEMPLINVLKIGFQLQGDLL